MKKVIWTDEDGYKRVSLIRDQDPDDLAPNGISQNPPDIKGLDWNYIWMQINNLLVDRGLLTFEDICKPHSGIENTIIVAIKPHLISAYKERPNG